MKLSPRLRKQGWKRSSLSCAPKCSVFTARKFCCFLLATIKDDFFSSKPQQPGRSAKSFPQQPFVSLKHRLVRPQQLPGFTMTSMSVGPLLGMGTSALHTPRAQTDQTALPPAQNAHGIVSSSKRQPSYFWRAGQVTLMADVPPALTGCLVTEQLHQAS